MVRSRVFRFGRLSASVVATLVLTVLAAVPLEAQQTVVPRYVVYGGFTGFSTPGLDLTERGFNFQGGTNFSRWLAGGFDYTYVTGHSSLTPAMLKPSLQQQIDGEIALLEAAGQLPPGYQLSVPTDSTTQTYALGPQVEYRHLRRETLFLRPSIGAVHQTAVPHANPADPFAQAVVAQLTPSGKKTDWQGFYGFGGGVTWKLTNHVGLRTQADLVYWTLYNDLITGKWTVRYSVGPTFSFGKNVAGK